MHDLLSFTWNFQVPDNLVPREILKLTTIFVSPWKNQKYLFIINLFTPLLQMKLFWRNNIAFTKKCIIYLLVLYSKLTFPNFTSQLMSTVEESISWHYFSCSCAAVFRSSHLEGLRKVRVMRKDLKNSSRQVHFSIRVQFTGLQCW